MTFSPSFEGLCRLRLRNTFLSCPNSCGAIPQGGAVSAQIPRCKNADTYNEYGSRARLQSLVERPITRQPWGQYDEPHTVVNHILQPKVNVSSHEIMKVNTLISLVRTSRSLLTPDPCAVVVVAGTLCVSFSLMSVACW